MRFESCNGFDANRLGELLGSPLFFCRNFRNFLEKRCGSRGIRIWRWVALGDLVVAIDLSEDGPRVIALVGAREYVVKSRVFGRACSGLRYFRRVGSDRKTRYLESFRKRYAELKSLLEVAKIFLSVEELRRFVDGASPRIAIAIVDDMLYNTISVETKIREGIRNRGT